MSTYYILAEDLKDILEALSNAQPMLHELLDGIPTKDQNGDLYVTDYNELTYSLWLQSPSKPPVALNETRDRVIIVVNPCTCLGRKVKFYWRQIYSFFDSHISGLAYGIASLVDSDLANLQAWNTMLQNRNSPSTGQQDYEEGGVLFAAQDLIAHADLTVGSLSVCAPQLAALSAAIPLINPSTLESRKTAGAAITAAAEELEACIWNHIQDPDHRPFISMAQTNICCCC